jgi:hypothetical protein
MSDAIGELNQIMKYFIEESEAIGFREGIWSACKGGRLLHQLKNDYILVPRSEVPRGLNEAIEANKRPDGAPDKAYYVECHFEHPKNKLEQAAALLAENGEE